METVVIEQGTFRILGYSANPYVPGSFQSFATDIRCDKNVSLK